MHLRPTRFALAPRLLSAEGPTHGTDAWPGEGVRAMLVLPLALGGGGHVCCGQMRYWVLRRVPPDVEVSRGAMRALFLAIAL
jgi:hypothetical protein